jgi:hypothetical protein
MASAAVRQLWRCSSDGMQKRCTAMLKQAWFAVNETMPTDLFHAKI